jgi:poly-gamma-glutamate capsule biosynthesis protein CapA/YwtB (metallophosphatase superfamily)
MIRRLKLAIITLILPWSVLADPLTIRTEQSCPAPSLMSADRAHDGDDIRLRFVGDIVLPTQANKPSNNQADDLFAGVTDYLRSADLAFGNLEGVLTTQTIPRRPSEEGRIYNFAFDPRFAPVLKQMGFTTLNVANNHSHDYGLQGYADTIKHLTDTQFNIVGVKGDIAIQTVKGLRIAFVGFGFYAHQNTIQNLTETTRLISEAKTRADLVIASFHGGEEGPHALWQDDKIEYFLEENRGNSVAFARAAIDAGADAVIGHGPHVLRAIECYKSRPIVYSLGNFMTFGGLSSQGTTGQSMIFGLTMNSRGQISGIDILPLLQTQHKMPWYDENHQALELITRLGRNARHKGEFLAYAPPPESLAHADPLYRDALEAKRSFNFTEIIRLTTRYPLKPLPPLVVKGQEQDMQAALPHLDMLLSQNRLQQVILHKSQPRLDPLSIALQDGLIDDVPEISTSITTSRLHLQDLLAPYQRKISTLKPTTTASRE